MTLPDTRIYYAQNREDLILESFFPELKKGFYVDVGACHPDVASVTKRFYLQGWHGINIEPQANLHGLFERDRQRDINLNVGISDKEGTIVLRAYTYNGGLSTAVSGLKQEYEKSTSNNTQEYEDIPIHVTTLKKILADHDVKSIQFLKVDVEGFEYEVLNGNDWLHFRPEVICIEANHIVKDWRPLLKKNGYTKVFFDGLNEYYADNKTKRAETFNFVDHVLMELKGGISADDYDLTQSYKETKSSTESKVKKVYKNIRKHL